MVTQIIDGLYQLKVPIPNSALVATNIYLLKGDKGYTLIDTGWGGERAFNSLKGQLAEIGVGLLEILLKKEWKGFVDLIRKIEELHGIGVEG